MQHVVLASSEVMPFRQLENDICLTKNSVSILQRLIEDSGTDLSREDIALINYAADSALREVASLYSKFYAAMDATSVRAST